MSTSDSFVAQQVVDFLQKVYAKKNDLDACVTMLNELDQLIASLPQLDVSDSEQLVIVSAREKFAVKVTNLQQWVTFHRARIQRPRSVILERGEIFISRPKAEVQRDLEKFESIVRSTIQVLYAKLCIWLQIFWTQAI